MFNTPQSCREWCQDIHVQEGGGRLLSVYLVLLGSRQGVVNPQLIKRLSSGCVLVRGGTVARYVKPPRTGHEAVHVRVNV